MYGDGDKGLRAKSAIKKRGKMVRISNVKGAFDKGYIPNWSEEHFLIEFERSNPRSVFKLTDKNGEELQGTWYPEEVQEIKTNQDLD